MAELSEHTDAVAALVLTAATCTARRHRPLLAAVLRAALGRLQLALAGVAAALETDCRTPC
jgi:hypothetical protein